MPIARALEVVLDAEFDRRGRWATRTSTRVTPSAQSLRHLQVHRLGYLAALVGLSLERHAHAFVERADARALDGGDVHEHILAALVRRDEAEPSTD